MSDDQPAKHKPKLVRATGAESAAGEPAPRFVADEASKSRAGQKRLIGLLAFLSAIALEVWAIFIIKGWQASQNMPMLIGVIVGILALAITGSIFWKAANRLDPASKKDTIKFFVQNQLGLIMAALAFLPLLLLILVNKDMDKNQKALAGGIAAVAFVIAGYFGLSINPPSVEEYSEQIAEVKGLTGGKEFVYWTKAGSKYHLYSDCRAINTNRTEEIVEGSVPQARELKNITELCSFCRTKAEKAVTASGTAGLTLPPTASPQSAATPEVPSEVPGSQPVGSPAPAEAPSVPAATPEVPEAASPVPSA